MEHKKGGEIGHLVLDGTLTMRTVETIHAKLLDESIRHPVLEVDCSGAEEVDLSFIQLLLAARSSLRLADRTIRLAHPATGVLHDALQRGGFLTDQAADQAFWLQPESV